VLAPITLLPHKEQEIHRGRLTYSDRVSTRL
jgi:hypothetical protein